MENWYNTRVLGVKDLTTMFIKNNYLLFISIQSFQWIIILFRIVIFEVQVWKHSQWNIMKNQHKIVTLLHLRNQFSNNNDKWSPINHRRASNIDEVKLFYLHVIDTNWRWTAICFMQILASCCYSACLGFLHASLPWSFFVLELGPFCLHTEP